ncbi:L-aspartate oxidase [Neisseria sp. HMSC15G01]|uniref:FAD-binding protein n=2 Tax=unclassified Neisseria TaxID=2623750 RepID=UPI0008A4C560|nr:FAD-binding protein [Neisseria sp. HMSC15G01]OFV34592.1 L-aspartate oxidase [Neisseria sp. HMSC15G01]
MVNKIQGIDYETALANLRASSLELRGDLPEKNELLSQFHPDYQANARVKLPIGPNQGDYCHPDLAKLLISQPLIDDYNLSGAEHLNTDVLVIGGGGAGAAAALSATEAGARVIMANKLRIGDSNTVMAEGGIQAAVGAEDSLQRHFDDTIKGGHNVGKKELVAQMVTDAPSAIRWLIGLGMTFDLTKGADSNGMLSRKRAGGTTVPRILSYRDFTGLEMMRVLREAVELDENITQLNRHPAIELLSDEHGRCVGAILYDLEKRSLVLVHAKAVVLATGGSGRLHLQGFATSNHYGATADGLVLAYRIGAKLRDVDSFQYHPTGVAHPPHLAGALISEAVRSAGTKLVNGLGERFVDELQPRDVVAAAILRECREGRGVVRDGQVGVFLDTPRLIANDPDVLNRLVTLGHVAHKCGIDPAVEPVMIHPTLHYQNGGIEINGDGATCVEGLYCAGEVTGGIHGRNRLMGNALLDIISFGRRAGKAAAGCGLPLKKVRGGVGHVHDLQREMTRAGLTSDIKAPVLYPDYGKFDLREHAGLQEQQS